MKMELLNQLIEKYSLRGNWVDLILILLIIYFVFTQKGFINSFLELLAFVFSLVFSYKSYSVFGKLLVLNFTLPQGISNAIGFFLAWSIAEIVFYLIVERLLRKIFRKYQNNPINVVLGYIIAIFHGSIFFLFLTSFIFAFPVKGSIKQAILDSKTGPFFVNLSRSFESSLKNIFGGAVNESLNFLTIKPQSGEKLDLRFKARQDQLTEDVISENIMFTLVNEERVKNGRKKLVNNEKLTKVARIYAREMFLNGFFAHISILDNSSPAERADKGGIVYRVIGENLAYAPDVYVAYQGLMNSEGHRKNILSEDYGRVGIGVVDGGIYGRMFVQEFTD